jgi:hypothetical protein
MRVVITIGRIALLAAILMVALIGTSMLAGAQEEHRQNQRQDRNKKDQKPQQEQDRNGRNPQQDRNERRIQQDNNERQQQQNLQGQRRQDQNWHQSQQTEQKQPQDRNPQLQQPQQPQWQRDQEGQSRFQNQRQQGNYQQDRLSQQHQQERIRDQQQRLTQYSRNLDQRQRVEQQHADELQRQGRMAHYRYQQDYVRRLREQNTRLRNERHDYYNDPFFYTGSSYRYFRSGRYYEINQYGANLLRDAINYGYEQGFLAGRADKQDRWPFNYQNAYAYQDANYGYSGYYVLQDEYNYYFREGFRRGYEDGYRNSYRYGIYSNGKYTIIGAILGSILDLKSLH